MILSTELVLLLFDLISKFPYFNFSNSNFFANENSLKSKFSSFFNLINYSFNLLLIIKQLKLIIIIKK